MSNGLPPDSNAQLLYGDCRELLKAMPAHSIDSCVTDPPYHLLTTVKRFSKTAEGDDTQTSERARTGADGYARLSRGFMGKEWDGGDVAFQRETWEAMWRVLKPGAFLVAFGGTRTYHRMACAIEDAGFEIRDQLQWLYGSGFPKSHDVSKGIDKMLGAKRPVIQQRTNGRGASPQKLNNHGDGDTGIGHADGSKQRYFETAAGSTEAATWDGWGTALKPACEPIVLARKPLSEKTVAANVLRWGTGALNIDGCRVATDENLNGESYGNTTREDDKFLKGKKPGGGGVFVQPEGRWPANVIHDGSEEVLAGFPDSNGSGPARTLRRSAGQRDGDWGMNADAPDTTELSDAGSGSAARFFYCAKANKHDRLGSKHPTVKPVKLLRWLVRLVTPPAGLVLDPFAGTGTTGEAALLEGFRAFLIERETEYQADIVKRLSRPEMRPS